MDSLAADPVAADYSDQAVAMKALMTDASGFVGSALARLLLMPGVDVCVMLLPDSATRCIRRVQFAGRWKPARLDS